jgi:hypothetical protein
MGIGETIGIIAGTVTILGGIIAATNAGRKWIKSVWLYKIRRKWTIKKLAKLSDEKYELEEDKLNKEMPLKEADLKEKASLLGQRWSSGLARKLLELNLLAAKEKIETRLKLDKKIIFSNKKIKARKDVAFLFDRLKAIANKEKQILNEKIKAVYKDCRANSLINADRLKIEQEIESLLKEKDADLLIEKETS